MENIKYKEFQRLSSFIWNKVDYKLFKESILVAVPGANEDYIDEKWRANKYNLINFYAFFEEESYDFIYNKMIDSNYER